MSLCQTVDVVIAACLPVCILLSSSNCSVFLTHILYLGWPPEYILATHFSLFLIIIMVFHPRVLLILLLAVLLARHSPLGSRAGHGCGCPSAASPESLLSCGPQSSTRACNDSPCSEISCELLLVKLMVKLESA